LVVDASSTTSAVDGAEETEPDVTVAPTTGLAPIEAGAPVGAGAIAGFGVNGQPRNWGTDGSAVIPALDLLVNDLGATQFRIEILRGQSSWETKNDNDDPDTFDWDAYDEFFGTKDFTDLWGYVAHVNQLGVTNIELSAHGLLPDWMGGDSLDPDQRDEYVETLVAFLLYARTRAPEPRPQFTMFSPWNESDKGPPEGISLGIDDQVDLLQRLVTRMNHYPELDGILLVAPESAHEDTSAKLRDAIQDDPLVRPRLAAIGFHRYGGYSRTMDWSDADPPQWLTEFNDWDDYCYTADWGNAMNLAGNLVGALQSGVTAGLVWTDYDAPHSHDDDQWETFGLLASVYQGSDDLCDTFSKAPDDAQLDELTYEPKPTYYAMRQFFRYIRPGAVKVPLSIDADNVSAVAYRNVDGSTVVVGVNAGDTRDIDFTIESDDVPGSLTPVVSSDGSYGDVGEPVALADGAGTVPLPASSVFTMTARP
jgi:hypothetical protein